MIRYFQANLFSETIKKMGLILIFSLMAPSFLASIALSNDGLLKPISKTSSEVPLELKGVGLSEQIGKSLNLNLEFTDDTGKPVHLYDYFKSGHPVLLSPVYFGCPGLCNFHLNGLTEGLKKMDWSAGQKYEILAVSFDPSEGMTLAAKKKQSYLDMYGRPGTQAGWHFLTGNQNQIDALMQGIGFKYKWNEQDKQWAHASAAIVLTPDGVISRYLPGVFFESQDVKFALNEAAKGSLGTFAERLVLFCFKYDVHQNRYTLYALNLVKIAGGIMILILAMWMIPVWIRARRQQNNKVFKKAL
jgi:protein SCO1/2